MIGFAKQPTNLMKFQRKIAGGLVWISHYLQNTYYFFPSKDTTLSSGEQLTICDHFYDDQACLASKLGAPQQTAAQPSLLQINPKSQTTNPQQPDSEEIDGQPIHHYTCTYNTNPISKPSFYVNCQSSSISQQQQSKQRMPLKKGSSASKCFSMENNNHQSPLEDYNIY